MSDLNNVFDVGARALSAQMVRLNTTASNIANAGTPGYKARDLDFSAALKARSGGLGDDQAVAQATRWPTSAAVNLCAGPAT
mgnify:CR=1 FL=1